ncbi:hypothetical protein LOZ53_002482 [Ophidiomyces ophidiicola]|nr:hypothetical protein LOZ62_004166 [Ophidiomyces ophidiicola]KAI1960055.1 hypothetical protein LOZ59_002870 [Ophidiomyces ophidiicola]KAI1971068.1 hypothetical protein LOZ56_003265 [Ophidiomyces ophidiicola]KAI1977051.1 hypothetical protein LOZ55_003838 [Ophidiomyces ophidiicola]KAI1990392.1 hypothetical protein LOZ54_002493 [Ophidiomyces ophidiicola]
MSTSISVPDARLGLTSSEWQMVVHQQQIALQGSHNGSVVSRGRGMGRSTSSSRAASAASSQGRLLLDPDSLQALTFFTISFLPLDLHFVRCLSPRSPADTNLEIGSDSLQLNEQSELSIQNTYDKAGNVIADADAEIARVRRIIASIDELEMEFEKIKRIRDIVKGFRARVEALDHRLDQASRRRR